MPFLTPFVIEDDTCFEDGGIGSITRYGGQFGTPTGELQIGSGRFGAGELCHLAITELTSLQSCSTIHEGDGVLTRLLVISSDICLIGLCSYNTLGLR